MRTEWVTRSTGRLHLTLSDGDGHRPSVVLVPGIGSHARRYLPALGLLSAAGYTAVGLDLRGHGHSEGPRGEHRYEQLIDDVVDACAHATRHGSGVVLFGSSLGAAIAAHAAPHIDELQGLVLHTIWDFDALPGGLNIERKRALLNGRSGHVSMLRALGAATIYHQFDSKLRLATLLSDRMQHRSWSVEAWQSLLDYRPTAPPPPDTPTLVLIGEQDRMTTPEHCQRLLDALPTRSKQLVIVPYAAHMLLIEHPALAVPEITAWLDRTILATGRPHPR